MVLGYSSCSSLWILSLILIVLISDSAIPHNLTGLLRSKPWMTLAAVLGEMGSVCGSGISMGVSLSGEQSRRGSGDDIHDDEM